MRTDTQSRRQRAERYRLLCESKNVVTLDYDTRMDMLTFSTVTMEGVIQDTAIAHFIEKFPQDAIIHPDSADVFLEALKRAQDSCSNSTIEYLADFYGKGYRWWRARYISVVDDNGYIARVVGLMDDIQAEKENEARLIASAGREASFRQTITAGALLALEFDIKTGKRVLSSSDIFPEIVPADIELNEMFDLLLEILHPEDRQAFRSHFDIGSIERNLTTANKKISFDCRARSVNGRYKDYSWVGITYMYAETAPDGNPDVLIYVVDIHEKKTLQLHLLDQARRDSYTGLLNQAAFREYFSELINKAVVNIDGASHAFVLISIDNMNQINETYGRTFGDKLVQRVAISLRAFQRDSASHLSGALFALCFCDISDRTILLEQLRILMSALTQQINDDVTLTVSIGISVCPADAVSFNDLYEKADKALSAAKKAGGRQYLFYSPEMEDTAQTKSAVSDKGADRKSQRRVFIRTFGYFDVFVNGQAIPFRHTKAKELLALLVDRNGGFVSSGEAISFLWEDEPANRLTTSRYRKVAMRLKNILSEFCLEDIVESNNGLRRVVPENFDCDYYMYVSGSPEYRHLFTGAYLTNYSWGESTLSMLEDMGFKHSNVEQAVNRGTFRGALFGFF